mmetsp:Transcript_21499/g.30128  ORF Transcript_21499/g.30128 Transcript_21499/m.30128 type:complete len:699 (-) Transcript_21499:143-2239(-)|eukprot:CAMPEP_0184486214 /NCGR_PEP_ID=MMETSP0113_2-20130426/7744_1 /TAXON_ID=91329 /ORGANISM="Norrisiella sphaerica, Strain BC52" /LENGTH=698 /DNA_ID=CAMNT_0026867991 /DNA_START=173 /DNA_END=2269 /DNA_ORIENTATION=+
MIKLFVDEFHPLSQEADDLNYDEPQNMNDGWDGNEMEEGGNDGWSDNDMSPKDGKEGWDDDDDGGWDDEQMATETVDTKEEILNGYVVIRDACVQLEKEMQKVISEVSGVLFVEMGQAEIALREYKWAKQSLETTWFATDDSPLEMRTRLGLSRKPDEWEEQADTTRIPCCSYIGSAKEKVSKREMKAVQKELYSFVSTLLKAGHTQAAIISKSRDKKFKTRDVIEMTQIVTSEALASSSISATSVCEQNNGTFTLSEGVRPNCGHGRCDNCWKAHIEALVLSGRDALTAKCNHLICEKNHQHKYILGCFCVERIPREIFEKYLTSNQKLLQKYKRMCLDSFLENAINFNIRPCPSKRCDLWYKKKAPKSEIISCECLQKMCFNCGLPPHQPIPCANALDWRRRCSADVQTEIWRVMNTAVCPNPNCRVIIKREIDDKDRCLHMICSQCKYHWCWACREEFRPGGKNKNHDNFYHCKLYDEGKLRPEVKRMNQKLEQVRREAAKLKFCEHLRSCCDKDIESLEKLQKTLEEEVTKNGGDVGRYKFIFDAISKLLMANEDKKRLYIVAFYAAMDNKKHLFEFQLRDMAEKTTKLLNMLQPNQKEKKSLDDFANESKSLNHTTKLVSAFLQKLRKDVQEGECVTILDKPDDKSNGWFCMSCKKMNPFEKFICECTACQVHGEKRCLRCNPENHVHYLEDH